MSNVVSLRTGHNYIGKGGFPLNTWTTDQYSDGAVGTPNPPPVGGLNPYYFQDPVDGVVKPIPGSPADK
jgi:hypothetical protein